LYGDIMIFDNDLILICYTFYDELNRDALLQTVLPSLDSNRVKS